MNIYQRYHRLRNAVLDVERAVEETSSNVESSEAWWELRSARFVLSKIKEHGGLNEPEDETIQPEQGD